MIAVLAPQASSVLLAQGTPPRQAPSGVDVSDGFYKAAGALIVATADGLRHVGRATKDLFTPDGKVPAALQGLREGSVVVVRYPEGSAPASLRTSDSGDEGPTQVEGVVTRIDRGRKEITVRFNSRVTETFLATEPADGAGQGATQKADPAAVEIDHTDETGQRVVGDFRKKS